MMLERIFLQLVAAGLAVQFSMAPVAAADLATAPPADAGLSAERLDRIESALQPYLADRQLAGAVVGMWAGLYNTRYWMDPKEHLAIVFMSQRVPRLPDIEEKVHAAVYQAIEK